VHTFAMSKGGKINGHGSNPAIHLLYLSKGGTVWKKGNQPKTDGKPPRGGKKSARVKRMVPLSVRSSAGEVPANTRRKRIL